MATLEQHERAYAKALEAGDTLAAYKIKQLAEDEQQARRKAQQELSVAPSIDVTPEPEPNFLERTQDVIERRQQGIAETFGRPMAIGRGVLDEEALTLEDKVLFTMGDVFGGIAEVGGDLLITGAEAITPDFVLEAIEDAVEVAQENPIVKEGLTLASQGIDKYQEWADNNRDTAKTLESYFNIGAFVTPATKLPPVKVGIEAIGKAGDTLEQTGGNLVKKGRSGISGSKRDKVAHMLEPAMKEIPAGDFDITPLVGNIKYDPKNPYKAQNIDIVNELPDVNPNKTYTYNSKVIQKAADAEKARLEGILGRTDVSFNPDEVMARVVAQTKENLAELGELEPAAAKAINKALQQATKRLKEGDGSLLDILQAPRDFDRYFNFQKAQTQAGATLDSARTFARNAMNDVLEELSANSTVKSSLRKQSAYLSALDVINPKRAKDGRLAVSRLLKSIGRVFPTTIGAQVATAGLIAGGLATYWPLLSIPAIGALLFSGTKAAFSPQAKLVLGEIIKESGKVLKTAESRLDKEAIEQLRADRLVLISLLNETPVEKEAEEEREP